MSNNQDIKLVEEVDWVSDEIKDYYEILNQIYSKSILQKYSYVKKVHICPESFNNIFKSGKWINDLRIFFCANYIEKYQYEKYTKDSEEFYNLGADTVRMLDIILKMLPPVGKIDEKMVLVNSIVNDKKYCDGTVKYTY